jgi:hypothetical protein
VLKDYNGEIAIHFPGIEGLEKSPAWVFPTLTVCLACGFVEFELPEEQLSQLKTDGFPTQGDRQP